MRLQKPPADDRVAQSNSAITEATDHDRNGTQAANHRAVGSTRSGGARSAARRANRRGQREPACRRATILQDLSLSVEAGRIGRHRGRQRCGKDHVAGDTRRTSAAVRRASSTRWRHFAVPDRACECPQSATCRRTTSSIRRCPFAARFATRPGCGCPAGTSAAEADRVVEETMRDLDLADRADVPIRALSGGQRKRASIAVELLTRPQSFLPRRTHLRARSVDRGRRDAAAAHAQPARSHRCPHDARAGGYRPM